MSCCCKHVADTEYFLITYQYKYFIITETLGKEKNTNKELFLEDGYF